MDLEGTFYQLIFTVIRHSFPLARTQISYNFKYISNIFQAYLNLIQNCYQQMIPLKIFSAVLEKNSLESILEIPFFLHC